MHTLFLFQHEISTIKCNQYPRDSLHAEALNQYSKKHNLTCLDTPSINDTLKGVYGNLGK